MSSVEVIDYIDVIDIVDETPVERVDTARTAKGRGAPTPRRPVLPPTPRALHAGVSAAPSAPASNGGKIALATVGVLLATLILLGVLAGDLLQQLFAATSSSQPTWLGAALEAGPMLAVLCGALAAGFGYSAHRQAERQSSANAATPPVWQLATATLLLVASLAVTGFTLAPAPFHLLDTSLASSSSAQTSTNENGPSNTSPAPVVSPTVTATPTPIPTATPAPVPHLAAALSTTALRQTCPGFYSALPSVTVTLDNSASNVDAQWQVTGIQLIPGTPHPFVSTVMSGTVPAGAQATLTFTPHPKLCYWNPLPGKVYHLTLSIVGGPTTIITDTIMSPKL